MLRTSLVYQVYVIILSPELDHPRKSSICNECCEPRIRPHKILVGADDRGLWGPSSWRWRCQVSDTLPRLPCARAIQEYHRGGRRHRQRSGQSEGLF